jgi:hypothetical protein
MAKEVPAFLRAEIANNATDPTQEPQNRIRTAWTLENNHLRGRPAATRHDDPENLGCRCLLLQRFGKVLPSLSEFTPVFFELLFQIGTRLARPTNVSSRLRSGRTKTRNTCLALRPLARQGHLVGTVTGPFPVGPS